MSPARKTQPRGDVGGLPGTSNGLSCDDLHLGIIGCEDRSQICSQEWGHVARSLEPPSLSPGADGSCFCLTSWGPFQGLGVLGSWLGFGGFLGAFSGMWRVGGPLAWALWSMTETTQPLGSVSGSHWNTGSKLLDCWRARPLSCVCGWARHYTGAEWLAPWALFAWLHQRNW